MSIQEFNEELEKSFIFEKTASNNFKILGAKKGRALKLEMFYFIIKYGKKTKFFIVSKKRKCYVFRSFNHYKAWKHQRGDNKFVFAKMYFS